MKARYLIRFDDLCPTMDWQVWESVERLLVENDVRPLLAIIPDNRDETLHLDVARDDFWDRVREWQARGWTIGMHGYQHLYVTRARGMFGYNDRSEFAGLSKDEQSDKIHAGLAIFERERVQPRVWVAPNHSFDRTTLFVLGQAGLRVISDGPALYPYADPDGMVWIPRQLYRFEKRPLGAWTVCLHHNRWTAADASRFATLLNLSRDHFTDVESLVATYRGRKRGLLDACFAAQRALKKGVARALPFTLTLASLR